MVIKKIGVQEEYIMKRFKKKKKQKNKKEVGGVGYSKRIFKRREGV